MKTMLGMMLLFVAPAALAANYGDAMPAGEPVAVSAADPAVHGDAPAKFSGRITQVCQKQGCWIVLEDEGRSARVMAKDHGFEVPRDASGRAVAYGVLQVEPLSEEHARHLVEDDGAQAPGERELRIVATAIEILD
ncbi:MAG TPA: DUF4920 domain-containing protein [Arenimonas sp.]|uniref:DUF4920 domain-containing protein n=1 Tax=Arenimonas sp. TaxID=1872635 RepID=UPI002D7F9E6E|nr:DUF4920 domain-containing protein [Arenimonas sp.]HEU0153872.1 DUF4920 domain-containing protein [Arenimonas sp.]